MSIDRWNKLAALVLCLWGCSAPDDGDNSSANSENQSTLCGGCTLPESGECVNGDAPTACGNGGRACVVCDSGFCTEGGKCIDPPSCGPDSCEGCCDAGGRCVDGDAVDECGHGGLTCEDCSTDATCEDGTCVRDCGPDTCAGCCSTTGLCVPGTEDAACGSAGGACTNCESITSVCSGSQCVAPDCAATCSGCCVGADCIVVAVADQCGANGSACVACGDGRACITGGCVVDPDGQWTVTLTTGVVAPTDVDGASWDGFNGLPDPLVEVDIAGRTGATPAVDDSLAPVWNDAVLDGAASDLIAGFTLRYLDEDVAFNDTICEIAVMLDPNHVAFDGAVVESHCPDQQASFVRWRLTPRP